MPCEEAPLLRHVCRVAWQMAIAQEAELRRELEARGYELQRVQGCSTIEQVCREHRNVLRALRAYLARCYALTGPCAVLKPLSA